MNEYTNAIDKIPSLAIHLFPVAANHGQGNHSIISKSTLNNVSIIHKHTLLDKLDHNQ